MNGPSLTAVTKKRLRRDDPLHMLVVGEPTEVGMRSKVVEGKKEHPFGATTNFHREMSVDDTLGFLEEGEFGWEV